MRRELQGAANRSDPHPCLAAMKKLNPCLAAMKKLNRKRDWSKMPDDMARLIMGKLWFSTHHCRFAAACRDWYRIAREVPCPYCQNSMSVLIPHNDVTEHGNCSLYLVSDSKTFEFQLPDLCGKYVHGSSKGWLAVADNDDFELSLINLLTRTQIKLPKPSYALDVLEDMFEPDDMYHSSIRGCLMKKIAVSDSPSPSTRGCVVAAIMSLHYKLFCCRPGDDSWTCIQLKCGRCDNLADVIFFGGKLYAAGFSIIEVDFDGPDFKANTMRNPQLIERQTDLDQRLKIYLVDCSGNLLYVCKFGEISPDGKRHKTRGFEVYKLDKNDASTWSRIYELGEHSLFLGGNESMAVSAGQIPWCKPNCIYFVDDVWGGEGYLGDNGVFSLNDGRIEMFDISHSVACRVSPSMWYQQKI